MTANHNFIPKFIVLEGIDGSGTTSLTAFLTAELTKRGHRVHQSAEPSKGHIGSYARQCLRADSKVSPKLFALLFAADRLQHLENEIHPALMEGKIVVCDRYVFSSWVYQSLDCNPQWVRTINECADLPDCTFLLRVSAETAFARVQARTKSGESQDERYDLPDLQRKLADGYDRLLEEKIPNLIEIDASKTLDEVKAQILEHCVA